MFAPQDNCYYTHAPQDFFNNLDSAFGIARDSHKLKGKYLGRVAFMYGNVVDYYLESLSRYLVNAKVVCGVLCDWVMDGDVLCGPLVLVMQRRVV